MRQFPRINAWRHDRPFPHSASEKTFHECKLKWEECTANSPMVELHRDLLRLRREDAVFARQDRFSIQGCINGPESFVLRWQGDAGDDRLMFVNLGRDFDWHPVTDPLMAPPLGRQWSLVWSSEDPQYGGMGTPRFDGKNWPVPGHAAVVFSAVEEDSAGEPIGNKPKPPANNS